MKPGFRRDASDEAQDLRLLSRPVAPQALPASTALPTRAAVGQGHSGRAAVDGALFADSDCSFARSPIGAAHAGAGPASRSGGTAHLGHRRCDATTPRDVRARLAELRRPHAAGFRAPHGDPQPRDAYTEAMTRLHRITQDPDVTGGRPCIRELRVTVGTIVGLLAAGHDADEVLAAYPYLERDDISRALAYAAWRT